MNVSKKLFSGILCASLLMAGAQTRCNEKSLMIRLAGFFMGSSVGVFVLTNKRCNQLNLQIEHLEPDYLQNERVKIRKQMKKTQFFGKAISCTFFILGTNFAVFSILDSFKQNI